MESRASSRNATSGATCLALTLEYIYNKYAERGEEIKYTSYIDSVSGECIAVEQQSGDRCERNREQSLENKD